MSKACLHIKIHSAYYIDDGKGGRIHVNVSIPSWSHSLSLLTILPDREICTMRSLILIQATVLMSECRTSGENIGDTGLIQSYRAWQAQFKDSEAAGNEYLLPGLDFTRSVYFSGTDVQTSECIFIGNNFSSCHLPEFGLEPWSRRQLYVSNVSMLDPHTDLISCVYIGATYPYGSPFP